MGVVRLAQALPQLQVKAEAFDPDEHLLNVENGVIDLTRERITYLLRGTVLRREAGGGAQPLAEGVSGLWLTYYDRADVPTTDPARVASVGIRVEVSRGIAFPLAPTVMETRVRFRNEKRPAPPPS